MSLRQTSIISGALVAVFAAAPALAEPPLTVDQYVETVLRSHPSSQEIAALNRSAEAERKATRLLPDPTVELSRDRAGHTSDGRFIEKGLSVSQEIPWPGTFSAGIRVGDRAAESFRASAESARWELIVSARRAFTDVLAARARTEIARRAEEDARSLRDLVQRRAELGETREADRIKAEVEWLRQQRALRGAEQEAQTAEIVLRTLAGVDLPEPLTLNGDLPSSTSELNQQELESVAARSPRVLAARAEGERLAAVAAVARRGRIPNLDVRVFRDDEIDKQTTGASIGVRIPLWNANRGEIARAEAAAAVAKSAAERIALAARIELLERLRDINIAGSQAALLVNDVLPKARESLRLARLAYEEGETSLLDLLDAQRTSREAEREAIDARAELATAAMELQRLAGPDINPWR